MSMSYPWKLNVPFFFFFTKKTIDAVKLRPYGKEAGESNVAEPL